MPAFFLSCRHNPDVQWLVYTDATIAGPPPNVIIKPLTLDELSARASDTFHVDMNVRGRKLCDTKVVYGILFAEDLKPFDFWAYSDLDIVWGQIRRFMTDELLMQHDILSSRRNRLAGHFTLLRNTPAMNRAFQRIPDVAAKLASPRYERLDEEQLTRSLELELSRSPTAPRVFWREEWVPSSSYQKSLTAPDDRFVWRNGRTFRPNGAEVMYIHFHKMKGVMEKRINFGFADSPRAFTIDRRGILA